MNDEFTIRSATLADVPTIVRHRRAMFETMGYNDIAALARMDENFRNWVAEKMRRGEYQGWFVTDHQAIIAGTGVFVYTWAPGPTDASPMRGVIYNVFTESAFRRQGLARQLMQIALDWCQKQGIRTVTLHASDEGRALYESLGFEQTNEMRVQLAEP